MTPEELKIITNADCIDIDQDPTEQGKKVKDEDGIEIWIKHLKNGRAALLALNANNAEKKNFSLNLSEFGISGKSSLENVYANEKVQAVNGIVHVNLAKHACLFLLVHD